MSEPVWTAKPIASTTPETEYSTVVDGLTVIVVQRPGSNQAKVSGWLADIHIFAFAGEPLVQYSDTLEQAQDRAIVAAHRLYAAGVRGEISYPVSCCDRLLPTRADAERHEADHLADIAEQAGRPPATGWPLTAEEVERLTSDLPPEPTREADATKGTVIHVTAQVAIEDGQTDRYVIGLGPIEDSPWWVVDCAPNASPVSVFSFLHREDAIRFRDALNDGDTDAAVRIRASEEQRVADAADGEEG